MSTKADDILKQRGAKYGPFIENLQGICDIVAAMTGIRPTQFEAIAHIMAMKLVRMRTSRYEVDHYLDLGNYAHLYADILDKKGNKNDNTQ